MAVFGFRGLLPDTPNPWQKRLELRQRPGVCFHDLEPYIWGLPQSRGYPPLEILFNQLILLLLDFRRVDDRVFVYENPVDAGVVDELHQGLARGERAGDARPFVALLVEGLEGDAGD